MWMFIAIGLAVVAVGAAWYGVHHKAKVTELEAKLEDAAEQLKEKGKSLLGN